MEKLKLPNGVTLVQTSSIRGSCCNFLKKKLWLRLYHGLFMNFDRFLCDPFGNPVHFNNILNTKGSDLDQAITRRYRSTYSNDSLMIRAEIKVKLTNLIKYPFCSYKNHIVLVTDNENYRIGNPDKMKSMKFGVFMKLIGG